MERIPSFETKEATPITPESVVAEIHSKFSNSRELANHIKERDENNYAMVSGEIKTPQDAMEKVFERLASYRRKSRSIDGMPFYSSKYPLETNRDDEVGIEDVANAFKSGQLYGMLVSSVYYGEATFISPEGKVLSEPQEM